MLIIIERGDTMPRKDLKNRTPVGSAVDNELFMKLKSYSKESSIPMSKLLDKAIILFLESTK